jgi:hypothetical protein
MGSIDSKLAAFRLKAAKNDVEVEHLTEFAILGDVRAIPVIREIQDKYGWSSSNQADGAHVVPLARWADVVCTYIEGGCDALVAYARGPDSESTHFAIQILGDVKSEACVLALADLSEDIIKDLPARLKDGLKLADAINFTLSFKSPPYVNPETIRRLYTFLHILLQQDLNEPQRGIVVCALRGVGNEESIHLIRKLPCFTGPWAGLESLACKAIRKRLGHA